MSNKSRVIRETLIRIVRVLVVAAIAGAIYMGAQTYYDFESGTQHEVDVSTNAPATEINVVAQPDIAPVLPLFIQPVHRDKDLTLSGVPSYGRMTFLLPLEANVSEARAKLDLRSEVPESVYATLRVTINGVRRLETVLAAGVKETSIRIDLKPEDLTRNTLEIAFAVIGNSTINICAVDQPASVVRFLPSSHLEVSTRATELSLMDRFRVAGGLLSLPWNERGNETNLGDLLLVAAKAMQADVPVTFTSPNLSEFNADEATEILSQVGDAPKNSVQASWPLYLVSDANNGGARIFTGRTNWRYQYSIANLPDDRLPGKFHYAVKLGPMMDNDGERRDWMLWFRTNGRLLGTRTAGEGVIEGAFDLPTDMLIDDNVLEISVGRPFGIDGVCNAGPPYVAELLPSTRLEPGEEMINGQTDRLLQALGKNPHLVTVGLGELTAGMALAAAALLADMPIMPVTATEAKPSREIEIVRPAALVESSPVSQVYYHEGKQGRLENIMIAMTREGLQSSSVVLLFSDLIVSEKLQGGL